jgi:beta-lactamase regulating signal transducer with metallopeptidase domain
VELAPGSGETFAVRAIHWCNPVVWRGCNRLREESERACDDAVLAGGVEAPRYAD